MAGVEMFESTLKEIVRAKRLSASKMGKLTELALKSMENDTQLVSILYRTHKSLPTAAKVSSLYCFDALSRAARSQVNKHGLTGDINSEKGNCATFLLKVEGVLDGLFHDLISTGTAETKEKSQKILDIWAKANTFPSSVLVDLTNIVKGAEKETEPVIADPRSVVQTTATTAPLLASPTSISPTTDSVQSTLLALLSQATNVVAAAPNNGQTTPNTAMPQLDSSQLALLQKLTQTAKLVNEGLKPAIPPLAQHAHPPIASTAPPEAMGQSQNPERLREDYYGPGPREARYDKRGSPNRNRDDLHDEHPASRGGFRGGFRGRGRGDGRARWDDRDRYRDRSPPLRARRSRSRSPPSRYGGRRDIKPYSPPRRPSMAPMTVMEPSHRAMSDSLAPEVEKDEFGRDIRPLPPKDEPSSVDADRGTQPQPPPIAAPSVDPAPTPTNDSMSLSPPSGPTNTIPQISAADTVPQPGLDKFDLATFDFTAPASWEALGQMWKVTHGYPPSQEALMQFVMSRSTAGPDMATLGSYPTPEQGWSGQEWMGSHGESNVGLHTWQGRETARFPRGGRGGGYRYGDAGENQNNWDYGQETDAIVLGGEGSSTADGEMLGQNGNQTSMHDAGTTVGAGGRMQRVDDRWVFVRDTPSSVA